jgi:hypothetical protein
MAKKTGKANLGPEMAKKAYEAMDKSVSRLGIRSTIDEMTVTKPGKTRIGNLAGGAGLGGMFGIKNR